MLTLEEISLKKKIEENSVQLQQLKIRFNRGITTGLNDAFLLNEDQKKEIISLDENNLNLIKPILKGKEILKYRLLKNSTYLINSHNGLKKLKIQPINVIESYPCIHDHLLKYKDQLQIRQDQGDNWFNLRNCTYLTDFEQDKIVFTKASKEPAFCLDRKQHYLLNTSYFIVGENLEYLTVLLNSSLIKYAFMKFYQSGGIYGEITIQALKILPIKKPDNATKQKICSLLAEVDSLEINDYLAFKKLENDMDEEIFKIYNLNFEEINLIKKSVNNQI